MAHLAVPLERAHRAVCKFNVRNFGEDGHDLAVRTADGRLLRARSRASPPGWTLRLREPGRYRVFCSLEGHEAKGMHACPREGAVVALEQPGVHVADADGARC